MASDVIDLRSDTVTLPTQEMLEAILTTPLGDDVSREDPTVNELEELSAQMLGKEAALLVTSGTQGNLVSLLGQTQPGDEIILEQDSHILFYEVGGLARLGGLLARTVPSKYGVIDPAHVEEIIRGQNIHFPQTTLVAMENTHNRWGGAVLTREEMKAVADVAHSQDLSVHLDGARIFNAAVALDTTVDRLVPDLDSVMFCLSKSLSAPVGSLVCGSEEFIDRARKMRKMVGGGMRQAGIIAAPGLVALRTQLQRLHEDHEHARILADKLKEFPSIGVYPCPTNLLVFDVGKAGYTCQQFLDELKNRNVLGVSMGKTLVRLVPHRGIERQHINYTCEQLEAILG